MIRRFRLPLLALVALTLLAACESDEDKAERYFQSALTYLEQEDVDRALIELRNVFDHDGFHKEARALYAGLVQERGNFAEAYGQYLRVVEQFPDTVEAREALALMALQRRNWEEATRHGEAAIALDASRVGTRAVAAALSYRTALLAENASGQAAAAEAASLVLSDDPTALAARRVVIDALLRAEDTEMALTLVDGGLEYEPTSSELHILKAQLLDALGREEETGAQLVTMYGLFPRNEEIRTNLIRWYLARQDFDSAAEFLRGEAGTADSDIDGNLAVVELINRGQGVEAAGVELDRLIVESDGSPAQDFYRAQRARITFGVGERDAAITELTDVLDGATPSAQTNDIRIILAQMLSTMENPVGAREQFEEVLDADPSNVDALKMRATELIRADNVRAAIIDLRTALDQSPRDTQVLALMAEAHLRDGNPELAQERLALAAQVSNGGALESLRYARFLMARNRPQQAENVLTNARQITPGNIEILGLLGEIYLRNQQWPQAQNIIEALRALDSDQAQQLARVYQSSILLGQNRIEEGLDYLRAQLASEADGNLSAVVQLVRTLILTGRLDEARAYVDEQVANAPDSVTLELLSANLHALQGQLDEAETIYRDLLSRQPDIEPAILQLQALLRATDREDEANAVVARGLETLPKSRRLRLLEAYRLEQRGRWEEAIAIYELLYEEDSTDVVVANNLASMLSNHRSQEEDLERAFVVARRLNGTQVPAFQDTLGWIMFLRGDIEEAIRQLEAAREGLPEDPVVAIHLGLAYAEAGRVADAKTELEAGLALAGERQVAFRDQAITVLNTL